MNLKIIEAVFAAGDTVSPSTLMAKGIISTKKGKVPQVKILGTGEITKKVTISGCVFSASVKAKVEKAGGVVL